MDDYLITYLRWLNDLVNKISNSKTIRVLPCAIRKCLIGDKKPEESSIQVNHKLFENKNLIIDSTSFKKYFDQIVEPGYTYEQALEGASSICMKYIKDWIDT